MEPSIYSYSLCIALPLMLFFGFYFLLAQTPEKAIFENYLRSRRIMGMALLLLAANYSVHFFFGIRFKNVHAAILMNLSTYFLCYYLFSSALITLLDRFYITRKRIRTHIILWIIFSGLSGVVLLLFPDGIVQKSTLLALAAWLVVYGLVLSRRVIVAYRRAVRIFDDTHADDIGAYIKWLSIFTYWALIFGVGCGLLTFLPDEYVYIWILSSIPFYVYLYHCYQNYLLFYEQVETAMEDGMISDTILEFFSKAISGMNPILFIILMMLVFIVLGFFISSSSGLAVLSIPIMAPLADTVGVSRSAIVSAYAYGLGLISFITPTGLILASLAMVDVTYDKWLKFIMPLMGMTTVFSAIMLIIQLYV